MLETTRREGRDHEEVVESSGKAEGATVKEGEDRSESELDGRCRDGMCWVFSYVHKKVSLMVFKLLS